MSAVLEKTEETTIVQFSEFESKLAEFEDQYDSVIYDLTVPANEKQAKSDKHTIGKVISKLDTAHKELKAPLKERTDLIDHERKRIKDRLLGVQGKIKGQLEAHEQAIVEHAEMLQAKVDYIRAFGDFLEFAGTGAILDSREVEKRLGVVMKMKVDDAYEDRKADATLAQVEVIKTLDEMLVTQKKNESEQAELENLRKEAEERERADREDEIRHKAAANAKFEVEQQAQRKIQEARRNELKAEQAVVRAKQEQEEAVELAAKREREKIEREQKEKEAKAERERLEDEANKANQSHRSKIHREAKESLVGFGMTEIGATEMVTNIKDGLIANVSINY